MHKEVGMHVREKEICDCGIGHIDWQTYKNYVSINSDGTKVYYEERGMGLMSPMRSIWYKKEKANENN